MTPSISAAELQNIESHLEQIVQLRSLLKNSIVGQSEVLDHLLTCALSGSHALLVGAPGLAKTLMVKSLANAFHWKFSRVQFTPDLMPSDITGYELLQRDSQSGNNVMQFRTGPIFTNLLLADEINRAAPKTQSALLEAMAERHVTIGGATHHLDAPFLVVATQNPIEQEGTYPLPEAQLDRFMMEIHVQYPTKDEEKDIVRLTTGKELAPEASPLSKESFLALQNAVRNIPLPEHLLDIAVELCRSTRPAASASHVSDYVAFGAGPRGSQNLVLAAKARALLMGRTAPIQEDLLHVAVPVLRHRIVVNHRAIGDGITSESLIKELLAAPICSLAR